MYTRYHHKGRTIEERGPVSYFLGFLDNYRQTFTPAASSESYTYGYRPAPRNDTNVVVHRHFQKIVR